MSQGKHTTNFMHLRQKNRAGKSLDRVVGKYMKPSDSGKLSLQYNSASIPYLNVNRQKHGGGVAVQKTLNDYI